MSDLKKLKEIEEQLENECKKNDSCESCGYWQIDSTSGDDISNMKYKCCMPSAFELI